MVQFGREHVVHSQPRLDTGDRRRVAVYAQPLGIDVAPHDCRRTFAKLAVKGGARLEQIQLSLGHASIRATERYPGVEQDLTERALRPAGAEAVVARQPRTTVSRPTASRR